MYFLFVMKKIIFLKLYFYYLFSKFFIKQIHTLTVRKIPNKKVLPSLKGTTTLFKTRFKYYASAKSSAT